MLREITDESKPNERWFTDEEIDLYVWLEEGSIVAFQLCYNKAQDEHALTWRAEGGLSHTLVDTDDASPGRNMSPLLLKHGTEVLKPPLEEFNTRSAQVPKEITSFILSKMQS